MPIKHILLVTLGVLSGAEAGAFRKVGDENTTAGQPVDELTKMLDATDNHIANMIESVKNTSYGDVVASIAKVQEMVVGGIANFGIPEAMKNVDTNVTEAIEKINAESVAASVEGFVKKVEDKVAPMMMPIQEMINAAKMGEIFKDTFDVSSKMAALKEVKFDSAAVQAITDLKEYADLSTAFEKLKATMMTFVEPANEFFEKVKTDQNFSLS